MDKIDETFTAVALISLGLSIIASVFSDSIAYFFFALLGASTVAFLVKNVYEYIVSQKTIYIVYNEALHHDSSYHEMVEVCKDRKTAEAVVFRCAEDIGSVIESGGFGDDFDEYQVSTNYENFDYAILGKCGYYEAWSIIERKPI